MKISNTSAELIRTLDISFVTDLTYSEYKKDIGRVVSNVSVIMGILDMSVEELAEVTEISVQTLRALFNSNKKSNPRFNTVAKLNNFVGDVLLAIDNAKELSPEESSEADA